MTWGVGVQERGSDGYYATVYCRCLIFHGCQYVSLAVFYRIFEEFHSRMRYLPLNHLSPVLQKYIVTLMNHMFFFFTNLIFYESVVWEINAGCIRIFSSSDCFGMKPFMCLCSFLWLFFIPHVWACRFVLGVFGKVRTHSLRLQTFRFDCLHIMSLCHFPLGVTFPVSATFFCFFFLLAVALASLWASKWAAHSSSWVITSL